MEQGNENHIARPAVPNVEFETLGEVLKAHIALDKGKHKRDDDGAAADLECRPTGFIVIVAENRKTMPGGLLFVYADDEKDCELDKFFFKMQDAYMMLSSFTFGEVEKK